MADGNDDLSIWISFVEADYLAAARTYDRNCPTCNTPRDCNNYYCLACKQGGLCPATFRGDGQHKQHPFLQVRRMSRQSSVDPVDLATFIDPASVNLMQSILQNNGSLCYLRTKSSDLHRSSESVSIQAASSTLKRCGACEVPIPNSQNCAQEFLSCSLQCLITLAERLPERNLLALREGALTPTDEYPLTAQEKVNNSRHARFARFASTSASNGNSHLDYAELPPGYRSPAITAFAAAAVANGDWDLYVGNDRRPRLD